MEPASLRTSPAPTVFVWRSTWKARQWEIIAIDQPTPWEQNVLGRSAWYEIDIPEVYADFDRTPHPTHCPVCGSGLCKSVIHAKGDSRTYEELLRWECRACGFWAEQDIDWADHTGTMAGGEYAVRSWEFAALREFELGDSRICFEEMAAHLRRKFEDIYYLSPMQFEDLIAKMYLDLGYRVRRTQATWDGGYDLVLLEDTMGEQILVECKRYKQTNKVSVRLVRELIGVLVLQGSRRMKLVTTSYATWAAKRAISDLKHGCSGLALELVDADRLLQDLGAYDIRLPPADGRSRRLHFLLDTPEHQQSRETLG